MGVMKTIFDCGIVPVIKLERAEDAYPLCKALYDGGINVAEITFRTAAAEESIRNVCEKLPEVLVGAGTVLNVDICRKAVAAGAKFIVTPGFNPDVVKYCAENNIPILPGVTNPTDIDMALSFGIETLKFFPAEAYGGIKTLKALSAPYPMIRFVPTGGIDATNIADYAKFDKILAIGGSFMVRDDLINSGRFDEITALTKEAVAKLHGFSFLHIGINPGEGETAVGIADLFSRAFGFAQRETSASYFTSDAIEVLKAAGPGECGHIAIKCNNVKRAIAYLERIGFETDKTTMRGTEENPTFIHLKESFGRFRVHLI